MQTILLNSLLALGLSLPAAAFAGQPSFELCFPPSGCVEIQTSGKQPTAHSLQKNGPVPLGSAAASLLSGAGDIFATPAPAVGIGANQAVIAVIRKPSRKGPPDGFCGAGYEDYLALLGMDGGKLRLYDQAPLQSCLKSVSLVSDEGDDPRTALKPASAPWLISYATSSPPDFDIRNYNVRTENGKLLIEQQNPAAAPGQ